MLREAVKAGTEIGLRAKAIMDRGELVNDDVMIGVVRERLDRVRCARTGSSSTDFRAPWRRPRRSTA